PLFGTQSITQTTWPIPTEIFSINSNEVISNVELKLNNNLTFNQSSTLKSNGRFHITGTELLYLLNQSGVIVSKAWGGNGDLTVEGNAIVQGEFKVKDQNGDNQFAIDNAGYVRAREIKVDFDQIPDYVFKKGYKLMPLEELEKFIEKEQHLPNIKSEKEFDKKEGVGLGEMNMKLLEKVEEQTLYILQLNKKLEDMQSQINNLKK
ncbi:MAG: hypothetical protein MUF43_07585, partial [Flavobacterium sp.]|nr:hypothetical protein [Flavobacterium sp.]